MSLPDALPISLRILLANAISRGCFAQAWSVGEILRVYDTLRMLDERDAAEAAEETEKDLSADN